MSTILVFVETKENKIKSTSLELLSKANQISKASGAAIHACIPTAEQGEWTKTLGSYGVSNVYYSNATAYNSDAYTNVVENVCKKANPFLLLATSSSTTKDFLPKLAARMDAGMISECTSIDVQGTTISAHRPMYSGKCTALATFENSNLHIVTCRPNIFEHVNPNAGTTTSVETVDGGSTASKAMIKEIIAAKSDKPDLTEAPVIVSVGRSIKSAENFNIMNDLADVLGAAVGASRAAVDAGYAPHSMQVGQTGKTVNPKLYISFGISGAIQHLAGMRTSKIVVAVNTDPEAPIFQKCDYGIVGDMFEVAPLMTEEFKKLLAH